uniref:Uncharacterized protein n=1 Tax=Sphaeramia orbicularis TaxID=375764 RepID=A0A672ZQ05_9TELE
QNIIKWHFNVDRKHTVSGKCSYQRPTVSSRTRALSPYTHRRMCQLSEDARQRLSHLRLGPHLFRKHSESQPPFLVLSSCSNMMDSNGRQCDKVLFSCFLPSNKTFSFVLHCNTSVSVSCNHLYRRSNNYNCQNCDYNQFIIPLPSDLTLKTHCHCVKVDTFLYKTS